MLPRWRRVEQMSPVPSESKRHVMARREEGRLSTGAIATRLGVSRLVSRLNVVKIGNDGRLPNPTRFVSTEHRYWETEEFEPWLAAGTIEFPRRAKETNRRPSSDILAWQYGVRRRLVELEGTVRTDDLAKELGVSRA